MGYENLGGQRRAPQSLGSDCRGVAAPLMLIHLRGTMILHRGAEGAWRPQPTTDAGVNLIGIASQQKGVCPSSSSCLESPSKCPYWQSLTESSSKGEMWFAESPAAVFKATYRRWVGVRDNSLKTSTLRDLPKVT